MGTVTPMFSENSHSQKERRYALVAAALASFLTPLMGSAVTVALPSIGKEFAMDAVLLTWVVTAYRLAAAVFLVPIGRIADIYGRKKVFTYGIVAFTLTSFLLAGVDSAASLILLRALQGVAAGMVFGTGTAILTSVFPAHVRGKVLGITVASVYSGLSIGPLWGGLLTERFGWRAIFLSVLPLGLLILGAVLWKVKGEWGEARGDRLDVPGSLAYALAIVSVMYGFTLLPTVAGLLLVTLGVASAVVFIRWELRTPSPVMDVRLFTRNRLFVLSNLTAFVMYGATTGVTFLLSLYLQHPRGLGPRAAGVLLVARPAVMALFSPFAGRLSDKVQPRVVASVGIGFTAAALFLLASVGQHSSLALVVFALGLLGFGFALFSSPNTNAIMSSVQQRALGVAAGTLATMRLIGGMFSLVIPAMIFAVCMGRVQITPDRYPAFITSLRVAFVAFTALSVAAVCASVARGTIPRD
jgi:EmrB/QacA subfamily drug resistance transporter